LGVGIYSVPIRIKDLTAVYIYANHYKIASSWRRLWTCPDFPKAALRLTTVENQHE